MAVLGSFVQQPADFLDYDVDYTDWLVAGDAPSSVTVEATPGMSVAPTVSIDTTRAKVWVQGGENKARYKLTVTMTTADGRIKQDEFYIVTKEF